VFGNHIINKIKKLKKDNKLTDTQIENLQNNKLTEPHPVGQNHDCKGLISGGLDGGENDDIRVVLYKNGEVINIGPHKEVYSDDSYKKYKKRIEEIKIKENKEKKNKKRQSGK